MTSTSQVLSTFIEAVPHAKLRLRIRDVRFDSIKPTIFMAQIRLGHRVYTTSKKTADSVWNEKFEVDLSLHEFLFWTIQIDIYECRTLLPRVHRGRGEVRLNRIEKECSNAKPFLKWIDLKHKQHCYVNLSDLNVRDPALKEHVFGSICLELCYKKYKIQHSSHGIARLDPNKTYSDPNDFFIDDFKSDSPYRRRSNSSAPTLLPSMIINEEEDDDNILGKFQEAEALQVAATLMTHGDHSSFQVASLNSPVSVKNNHRTRRTQSLRPSEVFVDLSTSPLSEESMAETEPSDEEETVELSIARELNSFLIKISGWVFSVEDFQVVEKLLKGAAGFGQGIEVGSFALSVAFLLVQRFYRSLPVPFCNNIIFRKEDLETPRIIYRYAFAAHGWAGLYAFGKRSELFSDALNSNSNKKAVMEYLQLEPHEMLICELDNNQLFRPNYYVAIDRRLNAVILSLRGTMSLKDTLTDLSCDYVAWHGGITHSGFLMAAEWFLKEVTPHILQHVKEYNLSKIIITGHSLGGATASLLTIMLTEHLQKTQSWPYTSTGERINIHCYSYGPPPILSSDLATKYNELIDTFVFGDDVVPRLCYGTVIDLQMLLVYAAEIGKVADLINAKEGSKLFKKLHECRTAIMKKEGGVENMKLWLTGRVHHIMTLKGPKKRRYTVIDTCGPERFLELVLRKHMLGDHLPGRYEQAFEDAYVTYILSDLEDRQFGRSATEGLKERMLGVVEAINERTNNIEIGSIFVKANSPSPSESSDMQ